MTHPTARILIHAAFVAAALASPVLAPAVLAQDVPAQDPHPADPPPPDPVADTPADPAVAPSGRAAGSTPESPELSTDEAYRISIYALKRALTLAGRQDWVFAQAEAKAAGPVAVSLIEWTRLRSGTGTFTDYQTFAASHADWPGMDLLRRRAEETLTEAPAAQVIGWFAAAPPQTGQGALTLIAALQSLGRDAQAQQVAQTTWRGMKLTQAEETALLARYGDLVVTLHADRARAMLDRGETAQAQRLLPLLSPGPRALTAARIALQRRTGGVDQLINAIPEDQRNSAGLDRDRTVWRWRNSVEDGAAQILLDRSTDAQTLGDPAIWATVRGQLARFYLRKGDARLAYKLAARHRMQPGGADWADLEWLAGYAALKLGDAPVALDHFTRVADHVGAPISIARAQYWRGRALEIIGQIGPANDAFRAGAQWQTAYYGLLSAERLGLPLDPGFSQPPVLPDWHGAAFTYNGVFDAATALHDAGATDLARRFLLHLQERQPADQTAPMAALAASWDDAYLALSLAKRAANSGQVLVSAYYPLPALTTDDLGVPEELALSIARRESEFDHTVVSGVGARGLMQLMPGTAQLMAPVIGEPYDAARLTTDPTYNARLGGAYLAQLRAEFGTSPVLGAAGYNAGPGRSRRWITEQGDPRLPDTDVIDWVEMIPFTETRNYVMRVAESLPIYRARLGQPDQGPIQFTRELRGSPPPAPSPDPSDAPPAATDSAGTPEAGPISEPASEAVTRPAP